MVLGRRRSTLKIWLPNDSSDTLYMEVRTLKRKEGRAFLALARLLKTITSWTIETALSLKGVNSESTHEKNPSSCPEVIFPIMPQPHLLHESDHDYSSL